MANKTTIELHIDSDPRNRHQEELGRQVFKIIGQEYRKPDFCFFGDWVWEELEVTEEQRNKIEKLLKNAYKLGYVRYAQW